MSCSKMLYSLIYSLLTSSEFISGGLKMQLINIHFADKGPLVIKFAKTLIYNCSDFQENTKTIKKA